MSTPPPMHVVRWKGNVEDFEVGSEGSNSIEAALKGRDVLINAAGTNGDLHERKYAVIEVPLLNNYIQGTSIRLTILM